MDVAIIGVTPLSPSTNLQVSFRTPKLNMVSFLLSSCLIITIVLLSTMISYTSTKSFKTLLYASGESINTKNSKRELSSENSEEDDSGIPIEPRVVGGHNAVKGEIAWQVRLEANTVGTEFLLCGGTMINYCNLIFIVTAAHCVEDIRNNSIVLIPPENIDVIANDLNQYHFEPEEWWYKGAEVVQHPDWDTRYILNDIALIRLNKHIFENKDHHSISLPGLNWEDPEFCTVSGWGGMTWEGDASPVLKVVEVPVLEWHKCKKLPHYMNIFLGPKEFCLTNNLEGEYHGICDGDSGGPCSAYNFTEQKWYLAGITSYSVDKVCGNPNSASTFTRVTNYVDWILGYAQGWLERHGTGDPFNNQTKCKS